MKSLAKRLVAAAAIALSANAVLAADSYLYWMVNLGNQSDVQFNYAKIKGMKEGDAYTDYLYWYVGDVSQGTEVYYVSNYANDETLGYKTGRTYTYLGPEECLSYLVELFNGADEQVGYGVLDDLALAGHIFDGTSNAGATPAVLATANVPEPTSGLLMLFGLAGLALRRKRA